MRELSTILSCGAVALSLSLGAGRPAHAQDWKVTGEFEYFGVGKVYQIEKGHIFWVGDFGGTFVSDKGKGNLFDHAGVKCPGVQDIDSNNKKQHAMGYCIIADAGGQAYLSWQCEGNAGETPCRGTFEYTGGTEKYQAISGKNTLRPAPQRNGRTAQSAATRPGTADFEYPLLFFLASGRHSQARMPGPCPMGVKLAGFVALRFRLCHGRPCAGHPRLAVLDATKSCMAGPSPTACTDLGNDPPQPWLIPSWPDLSGPSVAAQGLEWMAMTER